MTDHAHTIETLLQELYAIDPELRTHEADLRPLLERLLAERPDQAADPAFVEQLRMQLREHAATLGERASTSPFFTMQKFLFALGGAAAAFLIALPFLGDRLSTRETTEGTPLFSYSITETSDRAFGELAALPPAPDAISARPQSGGGAGGDPSIDSKMIAPDMVQYKYTFAGTLPPLTAETVKVLARQKEGTKLSHNAIARMLNLSQIDLESFGNANVDSINFYQDQSMGYAFYVNLREGSLSISPQWDKWPQPGANCRDEACFRSVQLKIDDVPTDDVLLSIADAFVKEHRIDVSTYGAPEVQKAWMRDYDRAENKSEYYIPDVQHVIYPLLLDGQPVIDESGMKVGISVGVNVRQKKVSDVFGIMNQSYLASQYPAVTDETTVRSYIEKLDSFPPDFTIMQGTTVRTVTVTLGEPTMGLTRIYNYDESQPKELVVPALIFPVNETQGADMPWRRSVIVPLAAELLKAQGGGISIPEPRPLILE